MGSKKKATGEKYANEPQPVQKDTSDKLVNENIKGVGLRTF